MCHRVGLPAYSYSVNGFAKVSLKLGEFCKKHTIGLKVTLRIPTAKVTKLKVKLKFSLQFSFHRRKHLFIVF